MILNGTRTLFTHSTHEAKSASDLGVLVAMAARYARIGVGKICTVIAPTMKTTTTAPRKRCLLSAVLACILVGVAARSSGTQQAQPTSQAADPEAVGPADRVQNVLNIQPVVPLSLTANWNLIVRWVTATIYQPVSVPQETGPAVQSGYYGLGDMQPQFYLVPQKKSKVIWGVGPQLLLPTATKTSILGQGKFGIGPTVVILAQPAKWTVGFIANNVWSVAGHPDLPDVNQFLLQYFINYNMKKGWYIASQSILTANWNAPSGTVAISGLFPLAEGSEES